MLKSRKNSGMMRKFRFPRGCECAVKEMLNGVLFGIFPQTMWISEVEC